MPTRHTVQAGDCLSSIAFDAGFFPDTVWNAAPNEALRSQRDDPNVLHPGDVLTIPDKRPKNHDAAVDASHRFRLKGVPEKLRVSFAIGGVARAGEACRLQIDDAPARAVTTGDGGELEIAILPNARRAVVTFSDRTFTLQLGHLSPVDDVKGQQMRLQNLGYYGGPIDGASNDAFEEALVLFQLDHGLEPAAEADGPTRDALVASYGA